MQLERISILSVSMMLLLAGAVLAQNDPTSPRGITASDPSTFDEGAYGVRSVEAIAGNVTALVIDAIGQTKAWQGYYGNITATITLDDGSNNTFYNWSATEPRGQVYATLNNSISWSSVGCYNFSAAGGLATWQTIESFYGIDTDDVDGVNETYSAADHPAFQVGSRTMAGCPTTYVFQGDARQTSNFANVLLYDNTTVSQTGWIYTTLIEDKTAGSTSDLTCFNGAPCDFQILVNDDGHGTDTAATTYYFWVEIA